MEKKKSLEDALAAKEASNKNLAEWKRQHAPEIESQKLEWAERDARLSALSQSDRRKVLDAAGMHDVSAAPAPLTSIRGSGYIRPSKPPEAIDWEHWRFLRDCDVPLWQAVALSVNINPDAVQLDRAGNAFANRLHIAIAHGDSGKLPLSIIHYANKPVSPVILARFAAWAVNLNFLNMPPELVAMAATEPMTAPAQSPETPAPMVTAGASDIRHSETKEPPLDLISFDEAHKILHDYFGATRTELAMWIFTDDLHAWTLDSVENRFLRFNYQSDGPRDGATTLLGKKKVQFSKLEVCSFNPDKPDKNEVAYTPGRWISYLEAKARIDAAAKACPTVSLDGVYKEWRKLHATFEKGEIDVTPMVIGYFPGGCGNLEDGFFRAAEIAKFIKHYIEDESPAPAQNATTPAPMEAGDMPDTMERSQVKRRTWRDVAWCYVVETFKAGQYSTAKELYRTLENKAGAEDSPFDKGTGPHLHSLYVREISETVVLKTIQNAWPEIKASR